MFTGIIEETGHLTSISSQSNSARITIGASLVIGGMKTGDSICTNGVCLTVITFDNHSFSADVMPETMSRSSLGDLKPGMKVNLERALRLCDRLGGHLVSGHIDGTGRIIRMVRDKNAIRITIKTDRKLMRYIVEQGSVAIDGISLTVVRAGDDSFEVSVIPHTLGETAISERKTGDPVNIECDMIAKYIEKLQGNAGKTSGLDLNFLSEKGFV